MSVGNMSFLNLKGIETSQLSNKETCVSAVRQQLTKHLKEMRKKVDLKQTELSKEIGMSQPYIARLESGKGDPGLSNVIWVICYLEKKRREMQEPFCKKHMIPWEGAKDGITERVAYVKENEPAADAVQRMLNEGFSQLPVLSVKYLGESEPYPNEIVGMITEQSILRSGEEVNIAKVAEMMEGVPDIISIHEEQKDLMRRFERQQAVLVKGDSGKIVGFMTRVDLITGLGVRSDSSSMS